MPGNQDCTCANKVLLLVMLLVISGCLNIGVLGSHSAEAQRSSIAERSVRAMTTPAWFGLERTFNCVGVYSCAWSPDGTRFAVGMGDATIRIWDISTRTVIHSLTGHAKSVSCLAWSPDGTHLASGSVDTTIHIWDAVSWQDVRILKDHTDSILTVAWSPDGSKLASGSDDSTIKLWNTVTWEILRSP